jgi:hypothetical protein
MTASLVDKRYFKFIFFFVLFGSFFYLYFDYFREDPLLGRDDNLLVVPMMDIVSVKDYFQKVSNNTILDVQPIRDLTFWLNIKLRYLFGFSFFHLTNYVIFCFLIFLVFNLFEILFQNKYFPYVFSLLFAVHPIMVSSVGWVSARKHSLATLFILFSIIDFLKNKNLSLKSCIFYVLSMLSHQIYCLFPLWIYVVSKIKGINLNKTKYLLMIFLGGIILAVAFYKTFLLNQGNIVYGEKFSYFSNLSRFVLSISRSFVLIFFPRVIAAAYYQGSIWNLVGIPVGVIFIFALFRNKLIVTRSYTWLSLTILSFLPTVIAFVHETYLYLLLICSLVITAFCFESFQEGLRKKISKIIGFCFLVFFVLKTISVSPIWMSNARLWHYSYLNEKSPYNAIILSGYVKNEKTSIELLTWAAEYFDFAYNAELIPFFTFKIYHTPKLSREEKIRIFKKHYLPHHIFNTYLALLNMQGKDNEVAKGLVEIKKIIHWLKDNPLEMSMYQELIFTNIKIFCETDASKTFLCKDLNIDFKEKVK